MLYATISSLVYERFSSLNTSIHEQEASLEVPFVPVPIRWGTWWSWTVGALEQYQGRGVVEALKKQCRRAYKKPHSSNRADEPTKSCVLNLEGEFSLVVFAFLFVTSSTVSGLCVVLRNVFWNACDWGKFWNIRTMYLFIHCNRANVSDHFTFPSLAKVMVIGDWLSTSSLRCRDVTTADFDCVVIKRRLMPLFCRWVSLCFESKLYVELG